MRILFLANHFNTGGITSYVMTLARGLLRKGHHVVVASSGGDRVSECEFGGMRHVMASLRVKCAVHPNIFLSLPKLLRLVKDEKIDIIHAHTRSTQVCAAMLSRLAGIPVVSTCHGFFKPHWGRRTFPLWGKAVIAISPQVATHLTKDLCVEKKDVTVVANGIDLDNFHPEDLLKKADHRRRWDLSDGPVIGIVARLSDVKGHCYLIDAMTDVLKIFPKVQCLIVGVGPEEKRLKEQVRSKGLEQSVCFLNVVNKTSELVPLLDIFILPSLQEGLGLSAMEAGACGVPVIASRVGGIPEVVVDGETGILVPSRDSKALADAIIRLLGDPAKMLVLGQRARQVVAERFSSDRMVERTIEVYQKVLR
ncbi:MAG: glycosyltransferase family 4 protein [Candidatus Omnitrophica bacterium]|nr:glycosyltransferase family 4 protein [Candidatus Omnitrophota bacterium]